MKKLLKVPHKASRKLRKFWALPNAAKRLLLVTYLTLLAFRLGLWQLPARYLIRSSQHFGTPRSPLDRFHQWLAKKLLPHRAVLPLEEQPLGPQTTVGTISPDDPKDSQQAIARMRWAIDVTSKFMPGKVKCLARALTMQRLMLRSGYHPALRIGVAHDSDGKFEAHAWIEHNNIVTIGDLPDLSRYTLLPSL